MSVGSICTRYIFAIDANADLVQAARSMREYHVGFLVVTQRFGTRDTIVGVLTDRDIVLEAVAQNVDPGSIVVKDIMTGNPLIATEDAPLHDTLLKMRAAGVRRVPVQNAQGKLIGVLTIDDVLGFMNELAQDVSGAIGRERTNEERLRA